MACELSLQVKLALAAGYDGLSDRALLESIVACACSLSGPPCDSKSLIASALANGYDRLSARDLLETLVLSGSVIRG